MLEKRILVADDHTIVRSGIKFVIKDVFPFAVIDEARNADEVVLSIRENDHNLIILDINMPETDPVALLSHLFACKQGSRVLIFSVNPDELYAKKFLALGALGYLNKQSSPEEVKKAIYDVLHGTLYTSQKIKESFLHDWNSKKTDSPFEKLSNKELLIAKYYLMGYSHTEIKQMLKLHSSTIGTLKTRLFGKLKIKNLVDLTELARLYKPDISDVQN
jgi:DNA-binding NarL/FixJ family response regulator